MAGDRSVSVQANGCLTKAAPFPAPAPNSRSVRGAGPHVTLKCLCETCGFLAMILWGIKQRVPRNKIGIKQLMHDAILGTGGFPYMSPPQKCRPAHGPRIQLTKTAAAAVWQCLHHSRLDVG